MGEKVLNVGIAGYGVVGKRRHHYIDKHPHLQTIAVCDQAFAVNEVMVDGLKCFSDYQQLLDEPLDILFVCLPNYLAAEVTVGGLQRNFHVFCEKPPGRNVEDIQKVIEAESKTPQVILKYGFNHRYHDSVRAALKIIQSGDLGNIINLRGSYGKSKVIPFSGGWRAERKYSGGGILLDQGIHMVDLMTLFCGEFEEIKSFISNQYWQHDVEDNAYVLMRDRLGRTAMLHSSATQWKHGFTLDIAMTKGYLKLQGLLTGSKSYGEETLIIGKKDESDNGTLKHQEIKYLEDNSWQDEINEFADAILNSTNIQYGTSAEALATMKLVYRIYLADSQWSEKYHINNFE